MQQFEEGLENLGDNPFDHEKFSLWVTHTLVKKYGRDMDSQELMERKRIIFRSIIDQKTKIEWVGIYAKGKLIPLAQAPMFLFIKQPEAL